MSAEQLCGGGHSDDAHTDTLVCVAGPGASRCKLGVVVERGERDECVADRTTRDSESGEEIGKATRGLRRQHKRGREAAREQACGIDARQTRVHPAGV